MKKELRDPLPIDLKPSCRKGAMLSDTFVNFNTPSNFLLGGILEGDEFDPDLWLNSKSTWVSTGSRNGPPARWKGAFCKIDENNAILFGGSQGSKVYFNDVWVFHTTSSTTKWTEVRIPAGAVQPSPRRAHTGVVAGHKLLVVFGGKDGLTFEPLKDLWVFHIGSQAWTDFSFLRFPGEARKGHTSVLVQNEMLVFGGRSSETDYFDDLVALQLDPQSFLPSTWQRREPKGGNGPSKRNHHVSVPLFSNDLLVYGGRDNHDAEGTILNDVWVYRINLNSWIKVKQKPDPVHGMPQPRIEASHAKGPFDSQMVMGFGQMQNHELVNDLWTLDFTSVEEAQWTNLNPISCHFKPILTTVNKAAVEETNPNVTIAVLLMVIFALLALMRYSRDIQRQEYEEI